MQDNPSTIIAPVIALGVKQAAAAVGLSERTLQYAINDDDERRRLKTVWYGGRRLVRFVDLQEWFDRVAVDDKPDFKPPLLKPSEKKK